MLNSDGPNPWFPGYNKCPAGSYNPDTGYTPCRLCAKGYYSSDTGAFQCRKCSMGFSTEAEGSTAAADCTGLYLNCLYLLWDETFLTVLCVLDVRTRYLYGCYTWH